MFGGVQAIIWPDVLFGFGVREEFDLSEYIGERWVLWLIRVFGVVLLSVGVCTGLLGVFFVLVVLA